MGKRVFFNYVFIIAFNSMNYLIIPGFNGSGPDHWQTFWENSLQGEIVRVLQDDWTNPNCKAWTQKLDDDINKCKEPPVLIAHSLGCITVVQWAFNYHSKKVKAAFLVAPADVEHLKNEKFNSFSPIPLFRLPFLSVLVASTNDPYADIGRSAQFAAYWGSKFNSVGNLGHINADSGIGNWPEGQKLLDELINY